MFKSDIQANRKSTAYYEQLKNIREASLGQHAEMWWYELGNDIPERNTEAWNDMYLCWHRHAFYKDGRID